MKRWKLFCGSLVLLAGLSPAARAQVPPPAGAAAAAPAAGIGAPAAAAPAPAPANLFSMLCPTPDQCAACKAKICNCALGKMLNNALTPLSTMTGGLVPTLCPTISPADLLKPADSAEGAAARIAQDEKDAKARRQAVRALGLVDCHYWPEATEALINALRADRNECVRLEAAWALGNGCCCNKATITALRISTSGSQEDGNPSESSPRVREASQAALAHCLACYTEVVPVETKKGVEPPPPIKGEKPPVGATVPPVPDKLPPVGQAPRQPTDFYHHLDTLPREQVIQDSKRVLGHEVPVSAGSAAPGSDTSHSLSDIFHNALSPASTAPLAPPPAVIVEKPAPTPAPVAKPQGQILQTTVTTPVPMVVPPTPPSSSSHAPYQSQSFMAKPAAPDKGVVVPPTLAVQQYPTNKAQIIALLHSGPEAEQRIWAAQVLGGCDGWTNQDVTAALIKSARTDANPSVRAACVQSLGRMNVTTLPVVTAVQEMKSDRDPKVRAEAEVALRQLGN